VRRATTTARSRGGSNSKFIDAASDSSPASLVSKQFSGHVGDGGFNRIASEIRDLLIAQHIYETVTHLIEGEREDLHPFDYHR